MKEEKIYELLTMSKQEIRQKNIRADFFHRLNEEVQIYMSSLRDLNTEILTYLGNTESVFALKSSMKSKEEIMADLIRLKLSQKGKRILNANFFTLLSDTLVINAFYRGKSNFEILHNFLKNTFYFTQTPKMYLNSKMYNHIDRSSQNKEFQTFQEEGGIFHVDYEISLRHLRNKPRCIISARRIEEAIFENSSEESLAELIKFRKKAEIYMELIQNITQAINENAEMARIKIDESAENEPDEPFSDSEATIAISRSKIKSAVDRLDELADNQE